VRRKKRFLKKARKNFLIPPAFERPQFGRSTAGGIKSFLVTFFQKSNFFPIFLAGIGWSGLEPAHSVSGHMSRTWCAMPLALNLTCPEHVKAIAAQGKCHITQLGQAYGLLS